MTALHVPVRQGTEAWLAYRRTGISASDIAVLLGLSPYRCEADLADEKMGRGGQEQNLPMKVGLALEDLIASEYEASSGRKVQRFRGALRHPDIEWAIASPDRRVVGEQRVVELKYTGDPRKFADGLPQDVEAQVAWQLGVLGWDVADVAVLIGGHDFRTFEVAADAATFDNLVTVAADFRRRLAEGGPFARNAERIRTDYPIDNGVYLPATPDLAELVGQYRAAKTTRTAAENAVETLANALRAVLKDASGIEGLVTYRKNADSTRTNWPAVASAYRSLVVGHDADELDAIQSIHSETVPGPRTLRLSKEQTE